MPTLNRGGGEPLASAGWGIPAVAGKPRDSVIARALGCRSKAAMQPSAEPPHACLAAFPTLRAAARSSAHRKLAPVRVNAIAGGRVSLRTRRRSAAYLDRSSLVGQAQQLADVDVANSQTSV